MKTILKIKNVPSDVMYWQSYYAAEVDSSPVFAWGGIRPVTTNEVVADVPIQPYAVAILWHDYASRQVGYVQTFNPSLYDGVTITADVSSNTISVSSRVAIWLIAGLVIAFIMSKSRKRRK